MAYPEECEVIYTKSTSQDVKSHYNEIAEGYNTFLQETNYVLSDLVAQEVVDFYHDVAARVVDIGCGTGKLGIALKTLKKGMIIDGIDFSNSMLDIAKETEVYDALYSVDVKTNLFEITKKYDALISSGVFTPGHLDHNDLLNLVDLVNPQGRVFVSVKKDYFDSTGFDSALDEAVSNGVIHSLGYTETLIWDNPEYTDTAVIVRFIKA